MFPLESQKPNWKRIIDEKEKRERDELEARFQNVREQSAKAQTQNSYKVLGLTKGTI